MLQLMNLLLKSPAYLNYTPPSFILTYFQQAPVAQLDRVTVSEAVGRAFESRRVHFLDNGDRDFFTTNYSKITKVEMHKIHKKAGISI